MIHEILEIAKENWLIIFCIWGILVGIIEAINFDLIDGLGTALMYLILGVVFILYTPGDVWAWLQTFDIVVYLTTGEWYEVFLKCTGALGGIHLLKKVIRDTIF